MDEFILEEPIDKIDTSGEEARLTRLIEAIVALASTREWKVLSELHFGEEQKRLERLLLNEAKKPTLNEREINRLQGELVWATRYSDTAKWLQVLRNKLNKLKHGN